MNVCIPHGRMHEQMRCCVASNRTENTEHIWSRPFVSVLRTCNLRCMDSFGHCRLSLSCAPWLYALAWWKRAKRIAFKYPKKNNQQNALNIKKQSLWKSNRAAFFVALIVVFGWFCFVLLSLKDEYVIDKSDFVVVFQSIALYIHSRRNGWMLDFFHLDSTVNNVHSAFLCSSLASGVLLRK